LLSLAEPGSEVLIADDPHGDRHERVILATQLGALTVIDSFALRFKLRFVDAAGNRIDLDAE
jgi:hypothetical protein